MKPFNNFNWRRPSFKLSPIPISRLIGGSSLIVLTLLAFLALYPILPQETNAITNTTTYTETRVSVQATASISVSLSSRVDIDVTPVSTGAFGLSNTTLGVSTNNTEGYKIFLYTSDGSGQLKNTDTSKHDGEGNVYAISSITKATSGTNFPSNTWGYALESNNTTITKNSTFNAVPTSSSNYIKNVDSVNVNGTNIHEDQYSLAFGTAISTALPAGTYSSSVVISVVANPTTITSLDQLVYMQDMNSNICANTVYADGSAENSVYKLNPITKQLIDVRDGKRYWVAKLADGHCWMTQNLALDLVAGQTLTSATTDLANTPTKSWTVPTSTENKVPSRNPDIKYNTVASWNLGQLVITKAAGSLCHQALPDNLANQGYTENATSSVYYGYNPTEVCSDVLQDVSGWTDNLVADHNTTNANTKQYDAHYLTGNYYTWNAATAGRGETTDDLNANNAGAFLDPSKLVNADGSICPAGWRLPVSGNYRSDDQSWPFNQENSMYHLMYAYGYPETGKSSSSENDKETFWIYRPGGSVHTSIAGTGKIRPDFLPIAMSKAGNIVATDGLLALLGANAFLWSSTPYPNSTSTTASGVYDTAVDLASVYLGHHLDRRSGLPIRCLAR